MALVSGKNHLKNLWTCNFLVDRHSSRFLKSYEKLASSPNFRLLRVKECRLNNGSNVFGSTVMKNYPTNAYLKNGSSVQVKAINDSQAQRL